MKYVHRFKFPDESEGRHSHPLSPPSNPLFKPPAVNTPYKPSAAIQHLFHLHSRSPLPIRDSPVSQHDETVEGPEKWPDKFTHLSKDSYGNLR